jgi:hypothetical protein
MLSLPKTRVGVFEVAGETRTEPLPFLTVTSHRTSSTFSCELASDLVGFLSQDPAEGAVAAYDIALASVRGFSGAGIPVIDPSGAGFTSLYSYAES